MPDVTREESDLSTLPARPAAPAQADSPEDPLGHLYKMSTTAGLGSQEYVAINTLAVLGIILGLASVLAVMANLLLVVPIAGFIFSAIALRQIESSNGTQTGKTLATLGILLSMGFIGFVGTRELTESSRTQADREAIAKLTNRLGESIREKNFEQAYGLFTPRFKGRISLEEFTARFRPISEYVLYGKLKSIETNGLANFQNDPQGGGRYAEATIIFHFEKNPDANATVASFYKSGDEWRFDDIPEYFPPSNQQ